MQQQHTPTARARAGRLLLQFLRQPRQQPEQEPPPALMPFDQLQHDPDAGAAS